MATLEQIRDRIIRIIQDSAAYPSDALDTYINEGLLRCAALALLADLENTGTFTTVVGESTIDIPAAWNFQRNLFLIKAPEGKPTPLILSSLAMLARKFPDFRFDTKTGDVEACVITQTQLIYYPIPVEPVTFNCAFYQKPTTLTSDTQEPSVLPDFLHYRLLVSFVCAEIYDEKEDGIDGFKVNTANYVKKFDSAIQELRDITQTGQSRPQPPRTTDSRDWI